MNWKSLPVLFVDSGDSTQIWSKLSFSTIIACDSPTAMSRAKQGVKALIVLDQHILSPSQVAELVKEIYRFNPAAYIAVNQSDGLDCGGAQYSVDCWLSKYPDQGLFQLLLELDSRIGEKINQLISQFATEYGELFDNPAAIAPREFPRILNKIESAWYLSDSYRLKCIGCLVIAAIKNGCPKTKINTLTQIYIRLGGNIQKLIKTIDASGESQVISESWDIQSKMAYE